MVKEIPKELKKEDASKPALEVELMVVGDVIFGRIASQDESLRSLSTYFEHEKVKICSANEPHLGYDTSCRTLTLYIRGIHKDKDYKTFFYQTKSDKLALNLAEKLKSAIEEFNKDSTNKTSAPTEPLKCKRIM